MIDTSLIDIALAGIVDVGVLLVCNFLLFFALQKIKSCGYINRWVLLVFTAAYLPVICMLWVLGIFSIYHQLSNHEYFDLVIKNIDQLQIICLFLLFAWFLFRLKMYVEKVFIEEAQKNPSRVDPVLIAALSKIAFVILALFTIGVVSRIIGIPLETIMLYRGATSIALGLGAQNILGNFFGSLMILINRPFRVGDWISSPDKKVEGIVEEIGWNSTRIRTLERRPLYVPNSIFTQIVIMNSSLMYNRHIKQVVCVRYQDVDKIDKITHDIERMLRSHAEIDQDQSIMADWIEFGTHALHIEIYAFTKTTNRVLFRKVQQDVCIKVVRILENYQAQIAVPLHVVHSMHHDQEKHCS